MNVKQMGHHSSELLSDPFVKDVLDMIEQQLTREWKDAKTTQEREDIWYTLVGHQTFVRTLEAFRQNAEFESALEEKLNG